MNKAKSIVWQPHPGPQTKALKSTAYETLYGGARGGGKTEAGLGWLLYDHKDPQYRALVIRRNADDLNDWIDRARRFYTPFGAEVVGKPAVIRFPSGAIIRTGHLKDESAYTKYLGHEYHKIVIEELTLIPTLDDYLKLISSCRSTSDIKPQVFATTNPGGSGHQWVKERFVDPNLPGELFPDLESGRTRVFIPARISDNPTLMDSDPEYVRFLDALPDELRKAWRDGDWNVFAGQFFKMWRNDIHVVKPFDVPVEWFKMISIDWGWTAPCAVGWYARSFDGDIVKYRELYVTEREPYGLAQEILDLSSNDDVSMAVGDPSMWITNPMSRRNDKAYSDKSIASQMISAGIPLLKANNDRISGWTRLRQVLDWRGETADDGSTTVTQPPRYRTFSNCLNTIKLLPSVVHDPKKPDDVDKKCEDHIADCDRYAMMHLLTLEEPKHKKTQLGKRIEKLMKPEQYTGDWMSN